MDKQEQPMDVDQLTAGHLTPPNSPNGRIDDDGASSLVQEMINKYYLCEENVDEQQLFIAKHPLTSPSKLPGKRTLTGNLELLVLNERSIRCVGDVNKYSTLARNVTELDLAWNSLNDWHHISTIVTNAPRLRHCNLSNNPLNTMMPVGWIQPKATSLTSLVLNGTSIRWEALYSLIEAMPLLEELHLSLNDYGSDDTSLPTVGGEERVFTTVHMLHLTRCNLREWTSVLRICEHFPCVESLVLAENPLTSIDTCVDTIDGRRYTTSDILGCLMSLNLNKTMITQWASVDALRSLTLLCELRFGQVPLLETYTNEERRHLVVARLPDVTTLNGSRVTDDHRLDSERFFIRHFIPKDDKPDRYYELVAVHGQLDQLIDIDLRPKTSAIVSIVCEELSLTETLRVALNQTVGQLKRQLENVCGIAPARMRLFYVDMDIVDGFSPCELRLPKQMLHSLHVADGDQFHIQTKLEARTRRRTTSDNRDGGGGGGKPVK